MKHTNSANIVTLIPLLPLTLPMVEVLMECYERQMLRKPPVDKISDHAIGLINKKLVMILPFTNEKGKKIRSLYLTELGMKYLAELDKIPSTN